MGDAAVDGLSDRGSIPLSSTKSLALIKAESGNKRTDQCFGAWSVFDYQVAY